MEFSPLYTFGIFSAKVLDLATGKKDGDALPDVLIGPFVSLPFAISSYYGYRWTSECREFKWAQAKAQKASLIRTVRNEDFEAGKVDQAARPAVVANAPRETARLNKAIDPTTGKMHLSYEYTAENNLILRMWVVMDGTRVRPGQISLALSFSAKDYPNFAHATQIVLLPDSVQIVPVSVHSPASSPKTGQLDTLVGTVQPQTIIASLSSVKHIVIRVGDTDIVMSQTGVELLMDFIQILRQSNPGPLQMRR